jgi:hypothetical protein
MRLKGKIKYALPFLFAGYFFMSSLVSAEEKLESVTIEELKLETGLIIPGYSDYQGKIGEYIVFDRGVRPYWGFKGTGKVDGSYFSMQGFYDDGEDQAYSVDLDFERYLKGEFDYTRFRHWLDHDPLSIPYLSQDRDPRDDYTQTHSLTNSRLRYIPPSLPNLTLNFNYREENRTGDRQVLSVFDQEILSDGKRTDEVTRDYEGGLSYKKGFITIDNTFCYRKFEDEASDHVFVDSSVPFTEVPEFDRYQNTVSARMDLPFHTGLYTNYTYYKVDGRKTSDAEMDYHSVQTKLTSSPILKLIMGFSYRYQRVENNVHKWYDSNLPSAMDRDIHTASFDSTYRLFRHLTLRYGFEWEAILRDSGLSGVHHTDTERRSHRVALQSRFPLLGKIGRIKIEYRRDDVDDPFMNLRSWHDGKEWDEYYPQLSNLPTMSNKVKAKFTLPLREGVEISFDNEWGEKKFDSEGPETPWKERYVQPSIALNYTPLSNLNTYLSYSYSWRRTDDQFVPESPNTFSSKDVDYKEDVNIWAIGCNYQPSPVLNLSGNFTYTTQKVRFDSSDLSGTDLSSLDNLGQFSKHDIQTAEFSLAGDYKISRHLFINTKFIYEYYNDDSIYLYKGDGKGYMGLIGLTWKFI